MHSIAAIIFVYLILAANGHNINYCGAKMCGYTNAHTLCQFSSGPSPSCTGMLPASLTAEDKSRILARLNCRRNEAASGKLQGLPSAGNMLKLHWIEELAKEAQLWADQCRPQRVPEEHDACRNLYSITVGQCVATVVGESPGLKVESMVDIWLMQYKYFKVNITLYVPPQTTKQYYGDFAQIMWAKTFMVGCGRSRFMLPVNGRLRTIERLVCNFAPRGPIPYRPLWNVGAPATACPSRSRPGVLTSLCDYHKEVEQLKDVDASMTIEEHVLLNAVLEIKRNETLFEGSLDEIYLTYLAIVTMQSTEATTSHFNSMHKRDIVEKIYAGDYDTVNRNTFRQYTNSQAIPNTTTKSFVKKSLPKKLTIVGRPKAYKIEELSNTGGDHKDKKNLDMTEAVLKSKRDFYYDYTVDTLEENVTIAVERKILDNDSNENYTFEEHTYETIPITMNTTLSGSLSDETKFKTDDEIIKTEIIDTHMINTTATNEFISDKDSMVDDYLSDPDAVRQLQEALDRMEHNAVIANKTAKKARRDVHDTDGSEEQDISHAVTPASNDPLHSYSILDAPTISTLSPDPSGKNDTPPVLSMIFKYMPYLKHYENEMLGPKNLASCLCPTVVLIIMFLHA